MSIRDQLTFHGTVECKLFEPNKFKQSRCMHCNHDLDRHRSNAVSDEYIALAIECSQKEIPATLIFTSIGSLYLGGFMSCGEKFLNEHNITRYVNCAKGLERIYVLWGKQVKILQLAHPDVKILKVPWIDDHEQLITTDDQYETLGHAISFIHEGLIHGENIVVHCAQGRSRSATILCAYLMVLQGWDYETCIKFVKEKRSIAHPNESFEKQLIQFSKSKKFDEIHNSLKN